MLKREVGGRSFCHSCVALFLENKGGSIVENDYHNHVQRGGLVVATDFGHLIANHLEAITDKIINTEVYARDFFASGIVQFDVLKQLASCLLPKIVPSLELLTCPECERYVVEILSLFIDSLIRTLLLGIEKSLNNNILDGFFARITSAESSPKTWT